MTAPPPDGSSREEALFVGEPEWRVPELADRYDYKKDPGSSDTRHQEDDIRT